MREWKPMSGLQEHKEGDRKRSNKEQNEADAKENYFEQTGPECKYVQ